MVLSETSIILYLDGVKVGAESNPFALTDILGEESVIQIGKANWGSGEYTNGYMDNLQQHRGFLTRQMLHSKK